MLIADLRDLCLNTCEIAKKAGDFIARERRSFQHTMVEYKGAHDLVSYVDREAEKMIIEQLSMILPDAGFIGEEGTGDKSGERFNWVIDPLDGTTNFIQGIPVYSVSIGLLCDGVPVLGVIYEIGQQECFYAWKNGGAWLDGKKIQVSDCTELDQALLATGFPYINFEKIDAYLEFLKWTMRNSRGVRRIGSAAVDMAYVACGRFDAFWEYDLKPWDVAAGVIIVREAGGVVKDFDGGEDFLFGRTILASSLHIEPVIFSSLKFYMG